jgi:hypothetical protein
MTNHPSDTETPPPVPKPKRRKKRKSNQPEMLWRHVEITSFCPTMRLHAIHHKGDDPYVEAEPWLELRGKALEPVKGVTKVGISMWARDDVKCGTTRPASVGSVLGAKPELSFGLTWPRREFEQVWALALSGHLNYARITFTKPHYNSALVTNASFSNEIEE